MFHRAAPFTSEQSARFVLAPAFTRAGQDWTRTERRASGSGYRAALAVSAGASVLGALAAVGIRRVRAGGAGQPVEVEPLDEVIRGLVPIGPR